MKGEGRRSERINRRSPADFEGIFKENSGTSENEEWSSSSDEDEKAAVTDTIIGKRRIKLVTRQDPAISTKLKESSLQIKLKMPPPKTSAVTKKKTPTATTPQIILPKDMDPEPVCPICLKIIIGDLEDINEHVDECIGPSSTNVTSCITSVTASASVSGTVTPLISASLSLVNVDEDDFGYGKDQYSEADIENIIKTDYSKQKKAKDRATESEQQETKNALLIQSILSTAPPSADFASLQVALKSLLDRISLAPKCAVCWETLKMPSTVSVNCWHVCCEECWLRTLGTKRLCPHCSTITNPCDLRKVFF